jgi:phosphatidylglycerophosphatase A
MSARTEPSASPEPDATAASISALQRKPRFALFVATAGGLGYLPKAPGTWGSLGGILLYVLTQIAFPPTFVPGLRETFPLPWWSPPWAAVPIIIVVAIVGVWSADRAAQFSKQNDPGFVVIDEVSGQYLAYSLALAGLNWKYLLVGFILFRVFDIWKPFPARQAEALPGGWGIMADDWVAGVYAGIGLWIARAAGL